MLSLSSVILFKKQPSTKYQSFQSVPKRRSRVFTYFFKQDWPQYTDTSVCPSVCPQTGFTLYARGSEWVQNNGNYRQKSSREILVLNAVKPLEVPFLPSLVSRPCLEILCVLSLECGAGWWHHRGEGSTTRVPDVGKCLGECNSVCQKLSSMIQVTQEAKAGWSKVQSQSGQFSETA